MMTGQEPPQDDQREPAAVEPLTEGGLPDMFTRLDREVGNVTHLACVHVPDRVPKAIRTLKKTPLRARATEAWKMVHRLRLLVKLWEYFVVLWAGDTPKDSNLEH